MKVLLTGATGFVGREIADQLHLAGHTVRCLARGGRHHREKPAGTVEFHQGDVTDAKSLVDSCTNIDAVIHLVGIISEVGNQTFENVHTRGTQNLVAAAQRGGVRRLVHMSALGTRTNAASRYHQSKWAAEELVRKSELDCTIFRPSLIYGPRDHFVNLFAKIIRFSPIVPIIGSRRAKFQPIAVDAVAAAFVGSLERTEAIGQTYDLTGPETLTLPQIIDQITEVMGRTRLKLHVAQPLARCQAALFEFVFSAFFRKAPPLNRDQLIMLQEDNVGNLEPANTLFGLKQKRFREGIGYVKRET
jgi:NADH dehydrogenase